MVAISGRQVDAVAREIEELHGLPVRVEKQENRGFAVISAACGLDHHKADRVAESFAMKLARELGESPAIKVFDGRVSATVAIIAPWC